MEYLKQTVKSRQAQNWFHLPSSFLDYDELQVIIMPIVSDDLSDRKKRAKYDIGIINANAERFNSEAEENLLFQDIP